MDGLEATRRIKSESPATIVLVVTTHDNPQHLLDAVRAGAAGYVLKDATKLQLLNAVRRVLAGESPLNQEMAMELLRRLAGEAPRKTEPPASPLPDKGYREGPSAEESLTARELEVLRSLASGKTNREVGRELRISPSTVKTYVQRIMAKLGVSDRTQAAVRALELGLLPKEEFRASSPKPGHERY